MQKKAHWQVRAEGGDFERDPVYETIAENSHSRLTLPPGLLRPKTRYFFRVAHLGTDERRSLPSEESLGSR